MHRTSPWARSLRIGVTDLGTKQGVVEPLLRLADIEIDGNDVIIAGKYDGCARTEERLGMRSEALEPTQREIELPTWGDYADGGGGPKIWAHAPKTLLALPDLPPRRDLCSAHRGGVLYWL